jgi:hypothetical protein
MNKNAMTAVVISFSEDRLERFVVAIFEKAVI